MARQVEHMKEKKKTQKEILLENAEEVISMMSEGKSYVDIGEKFGVQTIRIVEFTNESLYSARAKEAQRTASYHLLKDAENHLLDIDDYATTAKVRRCAELSQFKAYLAKTKNRAELDLNYKEKDDTTQQIVIVPADYINKKK